MREPVNALAAVAICVLTAGCATSMGNAETPPTTRTIVPRPVVERELGGLLLSPGLIGFAMGTTGMAVTDSQTSMSDHSATMAPPECLAIDGAAESTVYSNSGFWAERDQSLNNGDKFTHYAKQAVVMFPTVEIASAFFDASANQWPACTQYTHTQSGTQWSTGPIANENGTLSVSASQADAGSPGWGCGRALTLTNNVIIDVNTCSANPGDSAPKIAQQIAANITKRW